MDNLLLLGGTLFVATAYAHYSQSAAIPICYAILATEVTTWADWWTMTFILIVMTLYTQFARAARD